MASIYDVKPAFQSSLRPLTRGLANAGVTANQVTVFTCLLSMGTGLLLWENEMSHATLLLVPAVLFTRMALNAIDGMLAREHGMKSKLGAMLNELTDVISDAFLYLPFMLLTANHGLTIDLAYLIVPLVILAILSEMTGVIGTQIGASRRYDGPMGKSDRAFVFAALSLAVYFGVPYGAWIFCLFAGVNALLLLTIFNRAKNAVREAS